MSGHLRREILRKQTSICPYDEAIGLLKGGLQKTPTWFNSVKKYPPEQMWLRAGRMPRPAEFYRDRNRRIMNLNAARPDWVPSLQFDNVGMQTADAFSKGVQGFDPDVEFAACQSHFMKKKGMDEEEAYEQARFKMRDLTRQKQRVWEVYHRYKYGVQLDENKRHADIWIDQLENEQSEDIRTNERPIGNEAFNRIRHEGLRKHEIRMKLATSMKARVKLTEELRERIIDKRKKEESENPPERTWDVLTEVEKENYLRDRLVHDPEIRKDHAYIWERETEREIQLNRFIEMCDYIGRNKSTLGAGVKDPSEYIEGIEKQEQREMLMNEMARRILPENHDPSKKLLKYQDKLPEKLLQEGSKKPGDMSAFVPGREDFSASSSVERLRPAADEGYSTMLVGDRGLMRVLYNGSEVKRSDGRALQLKDTSTAIVNANGQLLWCNAEGKVFQLNKEPYNDENGSQIELAMGFKADGSCYTLVNDEGDLQLTREEDYNPFERDEEARELGDFQEEVHDDLAIRRAQDSVRDMSPGEIEEVMKFQSAEDFVSFLNVDSGLPPDEDAMFREVWRILNDQRFEDLESM